MSLKEKINKSLSKITNKNLDGQEGDNKKTRKIQIYIGVAVVCVIVAVGCLVIYNNTRKQDVPQVQTYMVPENEKIFINGLIIPSKSKEIAGPANGSTPDIRVSNGQTVKTGDVLYIVKDEAAIAEIASIKTQISNLIK
ncbi:MAG: efflux RND transporter periplasmic adaptor subunit, partial [Peptostreptococcus sp.]|nr:efflux RND transporter periplasmic adaptor subunit [Peptostreptococcus sp.]